MKFIVAFVAIVAVAVALPVKPLGNELAEIEAIVAAINSPSTDPGTAVLLEQQLASIIAGMVNTVSVGPAIIETSPVAIGPVIVETSPIAVGPAIVETSPVSVGPAFIDFPLPDGGAVTAEETAISPIAVLEPVQPSPVVIGEVPAGSSPLVQIIVNVKQAESSVVAAAPVVAPAPVLEEVYAPGPVNVVESADVEITAPVVTPVQVIEEIYQPGPVNVVESVDVVPVEPVQVVIPVEPVQVVNPVIVEPVAIGTPELPTPVVVEPVLVGTPIIPSPAVVLPDLLN